jgi:hypothetical protein
MADSLWMALSGDVEWLAESGLTVILMILLGVGAWIFLLGVKDLFRDLLHFFPRFHKNSR